MRKKLVIRILLLVAEFMAPADWKDEISKLSAHTLYSPEYWQPEPDPTIQ